LNAARGRPRTALLHAFDWREVRRGTERLLEELATGLAGDGYPVTVISAHRGRRAIEDRGGVRVVLNRRPPSFGPARRHALAHVPASRRSLAAGGFDLAHAFHPADALAAVRWSRAGGGPALFTVPAFPPERSGPLRRRWLDAVFAGAAVVVPTGAVAEAVSAAFPAARIEAIPPGVDTGRFTPGPGRATAPIALCAADLREPRKQVPMLARAFSAVRRAIPEARLVLANPYPGAPPAWARGEGIEVRPVGSDADLLVAYREAWVSVLPARAEPFGLVLAESMACGTPVLGAADGGIPEVVGEGAQGRVVPAAGEAREEAWAEALTGALSSPPAETAAVAARERGEHFSMRRCLEAYEDLYARLLAAG
jgi:glycosyltransferase involved in cell wall biosynthesis